MPFTLALADGIWVFLAFVVLLFFAVAYGLYSRSGSGIDQHPYNDEAGDAPGAEAPSTIAPDAERREQTRGAR